MKKGHLTIRYWRLLFQDKHDRRALFKCTSQQAKRFCNDVKKGLLSPEEQETQGKAIWRLYAVAMNKRERCTSNSFPGASL